MATSEEFVLKKYLTSDFGDLSHRHSSLLTIFFYDRNYYDKLFWKRRIDARAAHFFWKKENELEKVTSGSGYFQRKREVEKIIDDYLIEEAEEQKRNKQGETVSYLTEEEIEALLSIDSFRCRDMGYQEYEVGIRSLFVAWCENHNHQK